jgi:anti-sigma B factor antagonist
MSERVSVEVEKKGAVSIMRLSGTALDVSNVAAFRADFGNVVKDNPRVVLNFQNLEFIDSSGVGSLLSLLRQCNGSGGDVKLCALPDNIRSLFELVRINRLFEIFPTEDEAVRAF